MKKKHIKLSDIIDISASIVLYESDYDMLKKTIECFLEIPLNKRLFLIDNSKSNLFQDEFDHPQISYFFVSNNIGFGAGHNIVLKEITGISKYHLILNPDVIFSGSVITSLIDKFQNFEDVAMIAPKVIYPDGNDQKTCRRYPSLSQFAIRSNGLLKKVFSNAIRKGEYGDFDLKKPFYPDFIHGCFMLFKTEDFVKIKGFDERYFLYMEDVDICKKIDLIRKKKLYFPEEEIIHIHQKESSKNIQLFIVHFISVLKYFKKWGF